MTDLVILVGPANAAQLGSVAWQRPTKLVALSAGPSMRDLDGVDRTIGPAAFAELWARSGGIDAIAAAAGIDELGSVGLIAFSAGWAFADPALASGRVDGALLLDACFAPEAGFSTLVKPGYASFAREAAAGRRLLVMTGGPSGRYHAGAACVWQNTDAASDAWSAWTPPTVAPEASGVSGQLYRASYGANVAHGEHVSRLGGPLARDLLAPWLASGASSAGGGLGALIAVGAAVVTAGLFFSFLRS